MTRHYTDPKQQLMFWQPTWEIYRVNVPGRWGVHCFLCDRRRSYIGAQGAMQWGRTHRCP